MKIPLHYQMSEYDCGPTSMAAMMFLSNWLCGFGKIGRLIPIIGYSPLRNRGSV